MGELMISAIWPNIAIFLAMLAAIIAAVVLVVRHLGAPDNR